MPVIEKITANDRLPPQASAVVIGAGIIGTATALELAERGIDVVLLEKGQVAAEQSSRNWGWCRQMGRDPREIPLIQESLRLWSGMNARIGGETGFRRCGIVYLAETAAQLAVHEEWYRHHALPNKIDSAMIAPHDVAQLVPGSALPWAGGMHTASDGRAEPFLAVPAMARAVQTHGGKVFTNCAARGIEKTGGRVSAVVTEAGTIKTDSVIVAGGYWSRHFLNNLGLRFPQLGVVNSVLRTAPLETGITRTFSGRQFAVRKRLDGGVTVAHNFLSVADITPASFKHFFDFLPTLRLDWKTIRLRIGKRFVDESMLKSKWALDQVSPFELVRILDPVPIPSVLEEAVRGLKSSFPAFKNLQVVESWAGMIDATPDAVPVIDRIEKLPGLFLASGFSGHGFGIGPAAGKLMAQMVTNEATCVDPAPFRYSRFLDGSRPRPTTGL
jgi:glycine/D-amino acid oxidase-like deaminating enzyme